jgi:hypothetical protein
LRIKPRSSVGLRTLATVVGLTALGVGLAAAPANAKPAVTAQGSNCVVALAKGVNNVLSTTCFSTFTEAISFATNGAVKSAPASAALAGGKGGDLAAKIAAAAASAKDVSPQAGILGIEYEGLNFGGAWSLTFTGNANCTGPINDIDYQISLPPFIGPIQIWDAISSFRTFFSPTFCFEDHYYLQNFGLPRTGFTSSRSPVPTMNIGGGPFNGDNNTRSIRWS